MASPQLVLIDKNRLRIPLGLPVQILPENRTAHRDLHDGSRQKIESTVNLAGPGYRYSPVDEGVKFATDFVRIAWWLILILAGKARLAA